MANAHGRRTERRLVQRIKEQWEASIFTSAPHLAPWYEQNRFVGSLSIFITLVATVVAAMYGMKWLLIGALPFGCLATWIVAVALSLRKAVRHVSLLVPIGLVLLLFWNISHQERLQYRREHPTTINPPPPPSAQAPRPESPPKPSIEPFVYVIAGAYSPTVPHPRWIMLVMHGGRRDPVFNVDLFFMDADRAEEIRKRGSFAPGETIDSTRATFHLDEIDPIQGSLGAKEFLWTPLKPEDEHYEITIASRNGSFYETLQVKKAVSGWVSRIKVIDWQSKAVLLNCRDRHFSGDNSTRNLPACIPDLILGANH